VEPEGSSPRSQQPATGPYPEPGEPSKQSFIICTHPQISLGRSNQGEWGGQGMWHAWERGLTLSTYFRKFHLRLDLPSGVFLQVCRLEFCILIATLPCVLYAPPITSSSIYEAYYHVVFYWCFPSSPLVPNTVLGNLFSKMPNPNSLLTK
jgi:hypothetical protein